MREGKREGKKEGRIFIDDWDDFMYHHGTVRLICRIWS